MEALFAYFEKMHNTSTLSRPFLRSLLSKGTIILPPRLSYEVRNTELDHFFELKIRFCGNGSKMIEGVHYEDSYSPTCQGFSFRMSMGIAATLGMILHFIDASNAFQTNMISNPK